MIGRCFIVLVTLIHVGVTIGVSKLEQIAISGAAIERPLGIGQLA